MLRVSPDGRTLWVQTAGTHRNVVLDVERLEVQQSEATGQAPVQSAFAAGEGRYGLITHLEDDFVLVLDRETAKPVARIDVGAPQANPSFVPDGATAFVTVPSRNEVAVLDMRELAVIARIQAGQEPMGLVVFDPSPAEQPPMGAPKN